MTPQELQLYISQFNTAMTGGGAAPAVQQFQQSGNYDTAFGQGMSTAWQNSPLQSALQTPTVRLEDFLSSDAYRLQYGDSSSARSTDPVERFQNDPGIQAAIKAGMPALANSYSQRGLGASGSASKGMMDYMYNNYNQFIGNQQGLYQNEFNKAATEQQQGISTYLNQQQLMSNNFANYQNQLAALAAKGVDITSGQAQNQFTAGQSLANLLAQINTATGQGLANNSLTTAEVIAQLLGNQGVLNANAFIGTGAAMSNNILAGSQLGAQLSNAQNRSNAGTTNSLLGGIGAQNASYQLQGRGF